MTQVVFWCFGVAAVICALCCVLQRSPVAAALWLVGTMFNLAGLYIVLHAQFVAAVQVLVYAGAVMVLFLFVIMLLNLGQTSTDFRGRGAVLGAVALILVLGAELLVFRNTRADGVDPLLFAPAPPEGVNVVAQVAEPLFKQWLIPFEITSVLLLAAIVGAVVLAKRKV
jgi:NADH-quinone oxidoreductase subunit J